MTVDVDPHEGIRKFKNIAPKRAFSIWTIIFGNHDSELPARCITSPLQGQGKWAK